MKFDTDHAVDVALPTTCIIVERLQGDLADADADELTDAIFQMVFTALQSYFEFAKPNIPEPSVN